MGKENFEELQKKNSELQELVNQLTAERDKWYEVGSMMYGVVRLSQEMNSLNLDNVLRVAIQKIPQLLSARLISIYLFNDEKYELNLLKHNHTNEINQRIQLKRLDWKTLMSLALELDDVLILEDVRDFQKRIGKKIKLQYTNNYETNSCIVAPLKFAGKTVGVLNLTDKVRKDRFNEERDGEAVRQLCTVIGAVISNYLMHQQALYLASTDGLTGLFNHTSLMDSLHKETVRAQRYNTPLSVLILDVDKFKEINDKYGHFAGDQILRMVSSNITDNIRGIIDVAGRYGGDEFVIILPNTPEEGAFVVGERLRKKIGAASVDCAGGNIEATVSIGVAQFESGQTFSDLVEKADQALYKAKRSGRNKTERIAKLSS